MDNSETTDAYSFTKQAAPKGWSHPLKRSLLDSALVDAGLDGTIAAVSFRRAGGRDVAGDDIPPFTVHWWGTAQSSYSGKFSMSIAAVASTERQSVGTAIETALPVVLAWMARILASSPNWQDANHYACIVLEDGHARFEERS